MSTHVFTRLDRVIDEVHALFDAWARSRAFEPVLGVDGAGVLRLAVHEWVANLVQHATFPGPAKISLQVEPEPEGVRCTITDTSAGFDFVEAVEARRSALDAPMPSERGRGLLMLLRCAEDFVFTPATPATEQRVVFVVRTATAETLAPLFRPADLTTDYALAEAIGVGDGVAGPPPVPAPSDLGERRPSDDR